MPHVPGHDDQDPWSIFRREHEQERGAGTATVTLDGPDTDDDQDPWERFRQEQERFRQEREMAGLPEPMQRLYRSRETAARRRRSQAGLEKAVDERAQRLETEGQEAGAVFKQPVFSFLKSGAKMLTSLPQAASALRKPKGYQEEYVRRAEDARPQIEELEEQRRALPGTVRGPGAAETNAKRRALTSQITRLRRGIKDEAMAATSPEDPVGERTLFKFGKKIDDWLGEKLPDQPGYEDSFVLAKIPAALGSTAGFYGGGIAGAALRGLAVKSGVKVAGKRAAAAALPATQGGAVNAVALYEEAKQSGADEETAMEAFRSGFLVGTSEAAPVSGLIARFAPRTMTAVRSAGKRSLVAGGRESIEEAIQEAFQTVSGNAIAADLYDVDRELSEGLLEAIALGGIAGGTFGGGASYLSSYLQARAGERVVPEDPNNPYYDEYGVLGVTREMSSEDIAARLDEQINELGIEFVRDEDGELQPKEGSDPQKVTQFGNLLVAARVIDRNRLENQAAVDAGAQEVLGGNEESPIDPQLQSIARVAEDRAHLNRSAAEREQIDRPTRYREALRGGADNLTANRAREHNVGTGISRVMPVVTAVARHTSRGAGLIQGFLNSDTRENIGLPAVAEAVQEAVGNAGAVAVARGIAPYDKALAEGVVEADRAGRATEYLTSYVFGMAGVPLGIEPGTNLGQWGPANVPDWYDPFGVLGVSPTADPETIREVFDARSREVSPVVTSDPDSNQTYFNLYEALQTAVRSRLQEQVEIQPEQEQAPDETAETLETEGTAAEEEVQAETDADAQAADEARTAEKQAQTEAARQPLEGRGARRSRTATERERTVADAEGATETTRQRVFEEEYEDGSRVTRNEAGEVIVDRPAPETDQQESQPITDDRQQPQGETDAGVSQQEEADEEGEAEARGQEDVTETEAQGDETDTTPDVTEAAPAETETPPAETEAAETAPDDLTSRAQSLMERVNAIPKANRTWPLTGAPGQRTTSSIAKGTTGGFSADFMTREMDAFEAELAAAEKTVKEPVTEAEPEAATVTEPEPSAAKEKAAEPVTEDTEAGQLNDRLVGLLDQVGEHVDAQELLATLASAYGAIKSGDLDTARSEIDAAEQRLAREEEPDAGDVGGEGTADVADEGAREARGDERGRTGQVPAGDQPEGVGDISESREEVGEERPAGVVREEDGGRTGDEGRARPDDVAFQKGNLYRLAGDVGHGTDEGVVPAGTEVVVTNESDGLRGITIETSDGREFTVAPQDLVAAEPTEGESVPTAEVTDRVSVEGEGLTQEEVDAVAEGVRERLPRELRGAKPRYGYRGANYTVAFADDTALALYITAQARKSKRDADYRQFLRDQGLSDSEIEAGGQAVREQLKKQAAARYRADRMDGEIQVERPPEPQAEPAATEPESTPEPEPARRWEVNELYVGDEHIGAIEVSTRYQMWAPDRKLKRAIRAKMEQDYAQQGLPAEQMEDAIRGVVGSMLYPTPEAARQGLVTALFGPTAAAETAPEPEPKAAPEPEVEPEPSPADQTAEEAADEAMADEPTPDEPVVTFEAMGVPERSVEERLKEFAPSFYHLRERGVDTSEVYEEVNQLLQAAEAIGLTQYWGDILDEVADAVRALDPDMVQTEEAQAIIGDMWEIESLKDTLRLLTSGIQAATLRARERGPRYGDGDRELTPQERLLEQLRAKMNAKKRAREKKDTGMPEAFRKKLEEKRRREQAESSRDTDEIPAVDFDLTREHIEDLGGPLQRARQNIAAIRLAKRLIEEGRKATVAEQQTLVKYVGWGGLVDAFGKEEYRYGRTHKVWKSASWQEVGESLRELLTDEEYDRAEESTQFAHYTSPVVIDAMYGILKRMGVSGRVQALEPGAGVGHFIGLSPFRGRFVAIEKDIITGTILKALYPSVSTFVEPYQKVQLNDNVFDIAIGNPPFSKIGPKYRGRSLSLHDYFIIRSLDKIRVGGIAAFVTSSFTMDKIDPTGRQEMAKRANFLGAIRLPSNAFTKTAGTQVTTDVLFFQKRDVGEPEQHAGDWLGTRNVFKDLERVADLKKALIQMGRNGPMVYKINQYYLQNPDRLLGEIKRSTLYSFNRSDPRPVSPGLFLEEGSAPLEDLLAKATDGFPQQIYRPRYDQAPDYEAVPKHVRGLRPGQYTVYRRRVMKRVGNKLVAVRVPKKHEDRVKLLVALGAADRKVRDLNRDWESDTALKAAQAELTDLYESFVKKYGPISRETTRGKKTVRSALEHFNDQVVGPFVARLDRYDPDTQTYVKADIFTKRLMAEPEAITEVDEAWQAVVVSLRTRAMIDMPFLEELTGKTEQELVQELEGKIFRDPEGGKYVLRQVYLSGNVRDKLAVAKAAYDAEKETNDRYYSNIKHLEEAQPPLITATDIKHGQGSTVGASWIPVDDYVSFLSQEIGISGIKIDRRDGDGRWSVAGGSVFSHALYDNYGIEGVVTAKALFIHLLKREHTKIKKPDPDDPDNDVYDHENTLLAAEKKRLIQRKFDEWLWDRDPNRARRLVRLWNEKMNHTVLSSWDGEGEILRNHIEGLALEFKNQPFKPRGWQLDAVWRYLTTGNLLIGHDTGSGKTVTMILIAVLSKQMGLTQKPLIVTTRNTLTQTRNEFQDLFPSSVTLMADESNYKDAKARNQFLADAAQPHWDAIIMDRYQFQHLQVSPSMEEAIYNEIIQEMRQLLASRMARKGALSDFQIKALRKSILSYETKIAALREKQVSRDAIHFEDMHVDLMIVDEAHNYKNLLLPSLKYNVGQKGYSRQATDLYMKTRHMQRINPGRGVVLATATPIANKLREMYVMLRYLAEPQMKDAGYGNVDTWASEFTTSWGKLEMSKTASLQLVYRERGFINASVASAMFRTHADMLLPEDIPLELPPIVGENGEVRETAESVAIGDPVTGGADPRLARLMRSLDHRLDNLKPVHGDSWQKGDDVMFNITDDGQKLAMAAQMGMSRFVRAYGHDPVLPFIRQKPTVVAEVAFQELEKWKEHRGTVVIFAEKGVPDKHGGGKGYGGYSVYGEIKRLLVEKGIPEKEIFFIRDAKKGPETQAVLDKFNRGEIRVLIGQTENLGEGVNLNGRLTAMLHLDVPWRPDQVKQRDSRGIRVGNKLFEEGIIPGVRNVRFVTVGSLDSWRWQIIENKQEAIAKIMKAKPEDGMIEADLGDITAGQEAAALKSQAADNPYAEPLQDARGKVLELETTRRDFYRQQERYKHTINRNRERLAENRVSLERLKKLAQPLDDMIRFHKEKDTLSNRDLSEMGWTWGEVNEFRSQGTIPDRAVVIFGDTRFDTLKDIRSTKVGERVADLTAEILPKSVHNEKVLPIGTIAGREVGIGYRFHGWKALLDDSDPEYATRIVFDGDRTIAEAASYRAGTIDEVPKRNLQAFIAVANAPVNRIEKDTDRLEREIIEAERFVGKEFAGEKELVEQTALVEELTQKYNQQRAETESNIPADEFEDVVLERGPAYDFARIQDSPRPGADGTALSPVTQEHAEKTYGSVNKQMRQASELVQRGRDMVEVSGPYADDVRTMVGLMPQAVGKLSFKKWLTGFLDRDLIPGTGVATVTGMSMAAMWPYAFDPIAFGLGTAASVIAGLTTGAVRDAVRLRKLEKVQTQEQEDFETDHPDEALLIAKSAVRETDRLSKALPMTAEEKKSLLDNLRKEGVTEDAADVDAETFLHVVENDLWAKAVANHQPSEFLMAAGNWVEVNIVRGDIIPLYSAANKNIAGRVAVAEKIMAELTAAEIEAEFRKLVYQTTGHRMGSQENPLWGALEIIRDQRFLGSTDYEAKSLPYGLDVEAESVLINMAARHKWLEGYRLDQQRLDDEFGQLEVNATLQLAKEAGAIQEKMREMVLADTQTLDRLRAEREWDFMRRAMGTTAANILTETPAKQKKNLARLMKKEREQIRTEGGQRVWVNPQEWMAQREEADIAGEVRRRLDEFSKAPAQDVVRESVTMKFLKDITDPAPDPTFYHADPTDPEMRRKLVEGTTKPLNAWVKPVGTKVNGPQDIYRLASEYGRSKTQEIKQIFFIKDGVVVEVLAYTAGAIDWVRTDQRMMRAIGAAQVATGADQVVLIHNHPTGDPRPSEEDIGFAQNQRRIWDRAGFNDVTLTSMVLDSNTFSYWDAATREVVTEVVPDLDAEPDYQQLNKPELLGQVAARVNSDQLVVLGLDSNLRHVVTLRLPEGTEFTQEWLEKAAREYGFKSVAIATNNGMEHRRLLEQVEDSKLVARRNVLGARGYVLDVIYTGDEDYFPRDPQDTYEQPAEEFETTFLGFAEIPVVDAFFGSAIEAEAIATLEKDEGEGADEDAEPEPEEEPDPSRNERSQNFWEQQRTRARARYADAIVDARNLFAEQSREAQDKRDRGGSEDAYDEAVKAAKEVYSDAVFDASQVFGRDMQRIYREELFEQWSRRRQRQREEGGGRRPAGSSPGSAEDAYKIIGVERGADLSEVKKAYRKLVMEYHPDVSEDPDAHEKFITIDDAYNRILRDMGIEREGFAAYVAGTEGEARTEYGDVRKPNETRKKRDDRLDAIYKLMASFQQYATDERGMSEGLVQKAINLLRMGGVPKPAEAALEKLENARTPKQIRDAFTAIRRLYHFQMKRNAKETLADMIRRAKVPEMHESFVEEMKEVLKGINLRQVADRKTQERIGNGERQVRNIQLDELRELAEKVRQVGKRQAEAKKEQRKSKAEMLKELADTIVDEIGDKSLVGKAKPAMGAANRKYTGHQKREERPRRSVLSVMSTEFSARPATILEWLSPTLHKIAYDDLAIKGQHRELELLYGFMDPIIAAAEAAAKGPAGEEIKVQTRGFESWRTQVFQIDGKDITRGEALQWYLSMRDPTNLRIMLKNGITLDSTNEALEVNDETMEELMGIISSGDKELTAVIFNTLQDAKEPLNEAWFKAYLKPVANVANYVYRKINMREVEKEVDPMVEISQGRDPTTGSWGHLKARQQNPRGPLRIGDMFEGIASHMSHVARISAYIYEAHLVHTVLAKPDVRRAVEKAVGRRGYSRIKEMVELQTTRYLDRTQLDRGIRKMLRNAALSILGFRPTTWFLNMAGLFITAGYEAANGNNGFKWLANALPKAIPSFKTITRQGQKISPYWRQRYKQGFMNEVTAGLSGESTYHFGPPALGEYGMYFLLKSDELGGVTRWLMAEQKIAETMPALEEGSEEHNREVNYEWMRMLFNGENSSHGGDLSGALAWGRRSPLATTFVMFQSAVSRIYSLAWKGVMEKDPKKRAGAATGLMLSLSLATAVRLMFDFFDDWEEPEAEDAVRRFLGEAVAPIPILGGLLVPMMNRLMGHGGPVYPASVAEEFMGDVAQFGVDVLKTGQAAVTKELNASGEYQVGEEALKLLDSGAEIGATLLGLPYEGIKDMAGWGIAPPKSKGPAADELPDATQDVRRVRRAIRNRDNSLFRQSVRMWEETTGENMKSSDPVAIVNRWLGHLSKYEPGKPAREELTPAQLSEIDDALAEREDLRESARALAAQNADILAGQGRAGATRTRTQRTRSQRTRSR